MEAENNKRKHKKHKRSQTSKVSHEQDEFLGSRELNDEPENNINNSKPPINFYESDSEEPKKKKKKKKKPEGAESVTQTNSKNKSIRQVKREKHAQRQAESQAAAKEQIKSECLNYLTQWKHNKQNWKFMKAKQVWLYKNKFSDNLVPKDSWPLLLEYFESAKGNIRKMLLDDANEIIKKMDDWTESQNQQENSKEDLATDDSESKKPSEAIYKRARELIQFLQE